MKKIMFSDEFMLTKAVLEGRKTQTRRVRAVTCPVCNGKGYNISPGWNEPNPKCHACDGIGFLDAEIMIKWVPTRKEGIL